MDQPLNPQQDTPHQLPQSQPMERQATSRRQFIQRSARKLAYAAPVVAALAASKPGTAAATGSGS